MKIFTRLFLSFVLPISIFSADLRVGFDSSIYQNISRKDMTVLTDVWLRSILEGTQYKTDFHIYDDPQELSEAFKSGTINFIMSYGETIIKNLELSSVVPAFTGSYDNKEDEYYIVLVNSKYKDSWKDLESPKVGVLQANNIERYYFDYQLLKNSKSKNIAYESFFKSSRMLLRVFFDQLDMCMVPYRTYRTAVELNPQISKKLSIIEKTNITTLALGFYKKGTDKEMIEEFNDIAVNMKKDERGRSILELYKADGIRRVEMNDLVPIKELIDKYNSLDIK